MAKQNKTKQNKKKKKHPVIVTPLTLVLSMGLTNDFRSHENQNESDLSHLDNLKYIFCGHFDEKKIGGTLFRGLGKPSKIAGRGWLPHHFEKS